MNAKTEFKNRLCGQFKNLLAVQAGVLLLCLAVASSPAQAYTALYNFTGTNGGNPTACLVLSGGTLYGTADGGGPYDHAVFRLNTNGTGYAVLYTWPYWMTGSSLGLVLLDGVLFGTENSGNFIYRVNTDGSGYEIIKQWYREVGSDWGVPCGNLLLSDQTLYGTTTFGGVSNCGAVFCINTDGTGYRVLKSFTGAGGAYPMAGLAQSDSTLYGTTHEGLYGTIFKVDIHGNNYMLLHSFVPYGDAFPATQLAVSGTTLYGTVGSVVFKMNTDGSGYTILKQFGGGDEANAGNLLLSGNTLYGTTAGASIGGTTNVGTLFMMNCDGSGYTVLKRFTGGDGANPGPSLLLSGTTLYGTTINGGQFGYGVVFSLSLLPDPPAIQTQPQNQTVGFGETAFFSVSARGASPLSYQWFKDGVSLTDGGNIFGAQNATLTLSNVVHEYAGGYSVVITNASGSVTSMVATLSVMRDPFIITQPANQIVSRIPT